MSNSAAQAKGQAEPSQQQQQPQPQQPQQQPSVFEEDDEFEDFPVEDWPQEEAEQTGNSAHLWEESWDDDDAAEDFSRQLKEELKKVEGRQ